MQVDHAGPTGRPDATLLQNAPEDGPPPWAPGKPRNCRDWLAKTLSGSSAAASVWNGKKLADLANALDDGKLTEYIHYLLVHPD